MSIDKSTIEELTRLEESLWLRATRFDESYMRTVLAEDFFEFGRSGKTYNIEECLSAPDEEINAVLPLRSLAFHEVAQGVIQLTYISEVTYGSTEYANRSSIWVQLADGWKLKFHQGTPIES